MKNFEKYKTAKERYTAFCRFGCECAECKFNSECNGSVDECALRWLDLEAEEEKCLPCPFCGGECTIDGACTNQHHDDDTWFVSCNNENCYYSSGFTHGKDASIAAHNRVARAVMKDKEGDKE